MRERRFKPATEAFASLLHKPLKNNKIATGENKQYISLKHLQHTENAVLFGSATVKFVDLQPKTRLLTNLTSNIKLLKTKIYHCL